MEYELMKFYLGYDVPQVVRVSFELSFRDWCKLQDSEIWNQLEDFVENLQKGEQC